MKVRYDRTVLKKDGVEENHGEINATRWHSGSLEFELTVGWL
ncbi:protein of unknown function [Lactiplantibacillus plantarum]